ncbi:MAG: hypothetical protein AB9842_14650 [Bacteroidales bacterium]
MNNDIIKNILRFILLALIQVIILNRIHFLGFINPYLYVLFILLLPFETARWQLLLSSFLMGLVIDAFANTYGLHAGAATFMAFCRPGVLSTLTSRKEYEPGIHPGIQDLGFNWFLSYSAILILLHHAFLFYMEAFRFAEFFSTLFRVVLNSLVTLLVVFLAQYLFYRKN